MSIGPNQNTAKAPTAHPTIGHANMRKKLVPLVAVSRSATQIPAAKPAAVTTGADNHPMPRRTELPVLEAGMKTAIQPT